MGIVEIYREAEAALKLLGTAREETNLRVVYNEPEEPDEVEVHYEVGVCDFRTDTHCLSIEFGPTDDLKSGELIRAGNELWVRSNDNMPERHWFQGTANLPPYELSGIRTLDIETFPNTMHDGEEMTLHIAQVRVPSLLVPIVNELVDTVDMPPEVLATVKLWKHMGRLREVETSGEIAAADDLVISVTASKRFWDLGADLTARPPSDASVARVFDPMRAAFEYERPSGGFQKGFTL